jgi:hypothetical protein
MRIYLHDNSSGFRLCLFGELNQPATAELDRCWQAALSIVDGRKVQIDGTGLTAIQDDGIRLLGRMTLAGVRVSADRTSTGARLLEFLGADLERTGEEPHTSLFARASTGLRRLWCT